MNVMGIIQLSAYAEQAGRSGIDEGYSHCLGLRRLVDAGRIKSPEQLEILVKAVLEGHIAPADGIASGIAFRAARGGDFDQLPAVCNAMSADRLPPPMREASLEMGQRLWGVSRNWEWAVGVHQQFDDLATHTDLHHAVAFGTLVSETTSNQLRAIATYLFQIARSLVLTAVRAIPLDEIAGQRVLSDMQPVIAQLAAGCVDKSPRDIPALPMEPWIFP